MAVHNNALETKVYTHFVPHLNNPKTRYAIFALGIISSAGIAWQFGKAPLLCTAIPATLIVVVQKNLALINIAELNPQQRTERSAALAHHCYVIAGIWGIVLSGSTLALTHEGGKLLLQGGSSLNLLSFIKGINLLAGIGWFWAPLSLYLLQRSNAVLFNDAPTTLQASIEQFLTIIQQEINGVLEAQNLLFSLEKFDPKHPPKINENLKPFLSLFNFLRSFDYKSYLPSHVQEDVTALENQLGTILSKTFPVSFVSAKEELPSLKNKVVSIVKSSFSPPADQEPGSEQKANRVFHYVLIGCLALIPLYVNPIPTAVGLGLGWFYPISWGSEQRAKQLNRAPHFFEKTLSQKCFFVWKKTYSALFNISDSFLIGYPSAMVHGFFWSEAIKHHTRSPVQNN